MNMVCKVCGSELRGNAKFCNKCGVPLSLIERFGAKIAGSKSEMTVVAGKKEDDEVPTVDSPVLRKPVAQPTTNPTPVVAPPVNPTPIPVPLNPTFAPNPVRAATPTPTPIPTS